MKKLLIGMTVVALLAFLAVPAMAADQPEYADSVSATIEIDKMASLWALGPAFTLVQEDVPGGGVGTYGKAHRSVTLLSNCLTDLAVKLDTIPNSIQFHIVVNPNPITDWREVTELTRDAWLIWNRDKDGNYTIGAADTYQQVYTGHAPWSPATAVNVDYGIQICQQGTMPPPGDSTTVITWRITPNP